MILRPPTLEECQLVREWRNDPAVLPMLRTGVKSEADQAVFYRDVVTNPAAPHRYYALEHQGWFVGLGGLTYLDRVPGEAEISLILDPAQRGQGLGQQAVEALMVEAVRLGLTRVIGECYEQGAVPFWAKALIRRPADLKWAWKLRREDARAPHARKETRG